MNERVFVRAQILGELPSGQKIIKILANNADGITFATDEKSIIKHDSLMDTEEQCFVFKSPCSIGEPIFVIPSITNYRLNKLNHFEENNRVYEQIVCNIVFTKNDYLLNTCDGFCCVRGKEYGKTWFLLKSQAEAALQEMEKEGKQ